MRRALLGQSDRTGIQLARTALSSFPAFGLDLAVMVALTELLRVHYLLSAATGFIAGTTFSYLLSVRWIFFRRRLARPSLEYVLFLLVGAVGLGLNGLLLWAFTEHLRIFYVVSRILAASVVFFWNFAARKALLFR